MSYAPVPPNYVRLKRYNRTIFMHCDLNEDTTQAIKERIEKLTGRPFYLIRLYHDRQNLDDFATLYNCGIEKDGVELVMVYAKGKNADGETVWEELEEATNPPPSKDAAVAASTVLPGEAGAATVTV